MFECNAESSAWLAAHCFWTADSRYDILNKLAWMSSAWVGHTAHGSSDVCFSFQNVVQGLNRQESAETWTMPMPCWDPNRGYKRRKLRHANGCGQSIQVADSITFQLILNLGPSNFMMHLVSSLAALMAVGLTAATRSSSIIPLVNDTIIPGAYIVEFLAGHDHTSFYSSLAVDGVDVSPRMNMSFKLFNGSSFSITNHGRHDSIASKISVMPSVKRIWPMHLYPAPTGQGRRQRARDTPFPNVGDFGHASGHGEATSTAARNHSYSPHLMIQVDRLHAAGYTGKGVRIAIVDTGVDYKHPALGGCFGKGCLISGGYDLAGHKYDGSGPPEPAPYPYDDCDGHGTHVAGIIGAMPNEMGFTGAAPGAALSMYKVFSCHGFSTSDDILISAFNMAYEDGADIITASLGGFGGWSEAPWSSVVGRIVENGVPCTLAAGNNGWLGMWTSSRAADGKGVTAVSSFDNARSPYLLYKGSYSTNSSSVGSNSGSVSKPFGWLPGYPSFAENLTLPLFATSRNASVEDDACADFPNDTPTLSNLAVLIRISKACNISEQLGNVLAYNAQYVFFYGNSIDEISLFDQIEFSTRYRLKGFGLVLPEQGVEWVDLLGKGLDVHISILDESNAGLMSTDAKNVLTGGFVSEYTSWGPTLSLDVYPTLGAPGGNILSTWPLRHGGYAIESGTSMSTPFMAAVYALVGQARGTLDPAELTQYLSSTSRAQLWNDGTGTLNGLAPVPQQGAGLVQAYDAAFTTTHISTKGISFNDTDNFRSATFTIRNFGSKAVTYRLGNSPALSMSTLGRQSGRPLEFPNSIIAAAAHLDFSDTSVRIPPNGRANITVKPTLVTGSGFEDYLLPIYSGYVTINGSNGEDLAIPYLGVDGSMYSALVMTRDEPTNGFPPEAASSFRNKTVFTVPYPSPDRLPLAPSFGTNDASPSINFNLNFGTRILRADVIPLSSNYSRPTTTVLGRRIAGSVAGYPKQYLSRMPQYVSFDGTLDDGTIVPEGEYRVSIRALKIFGDPDKPYDYENLFIDDFTLLYQDSPNETDGARQQH